MEREEILQKLRRDIKTAKENLVFASKKFDEIISESPSVLPHPNGVQRIHNAEQALSIARQEHKEAFDRFHTFVTEGIVPDEL